MSVPKILIVYGTGEGHTARVAERIAQEIQAHGYGAEVRNVERPGEPVWSDYDAAILGSSIHVGHHNPRLVAFAKKHRETLEQMPSAFFSVSMTAGADDEEASRMVAGYIEEFERQTGWTPRLVEPIGGALLYTQYGFLKRWMLKMIARERGADTDTSKDHIYTDWSRVDGFADRVLIEAGLG